MKIKIGEYDIIENGSIIGLENMPIDFYLNESGFIVRLIFVNDVNQTDPPYSRRAEYYNDEKGLLLTFVNYNYPTGIGNTTPLKMGKLKGRELFFNYRIYSLENSGKLIHYTWLLGKEVKNG